MPSCGALVAVIALVRHLYRPLCPNILWEAGPSQGIEEVSSFVNTLLNSWSSASLFSFADVRSWVPSFRGASPMLSFFMDLIYL